MRHNNRQRAFTLLELVLVLVIIASVMAVAAPSLRGWSRGTQLRDSGTQFLSVVRWARAQAIAEARVHRLYVDPAARRYWVAIEQNEQFVPLEVTFGRGFALPEETRIQLVDFEGMPMEYVDFFPSGRSMTGRVRITSPAGMLTIECLTPAEGFALVRPQQGQNS